MKLEKLLFQKSCEVPQQLLGEGIIFLVTDNIDV